MVQVDLITGFLGAGKTTFLRRYVAYLTAQGHHVCILENDFGAVNVDAMLVQDLLGERCEIETISGGCDCDTHQRRMRTKLISMAMRGFDRVVVEPSGIFDVDEFFDVLRDEPLDRWYTLGNVFAVVDALLPETLSPQAEYILASEAASAGRILLSRSQLATQAQRESAIDHLKRAFAACKCSRTLTEEDFLIKDWADLEDADLAALDACGYQHADCEKLCFDAHDAFGSAYFLELGLPRQQLEAYLVVVTERKCIDLLRQQSRRTGVPFDEAMAAVTPPPCGSPVADAMGHLSPRYREALLLRYGCGYSVGETAKLLEVSYAAGQKLLQRAKEALRAELEKEEVEI